MTNHVAVKLDVSTFFNTLKFVKWSSGGLFALKNTWVAVKFAKTLFIRGR